MSVGEGPCPCDESGEMAWAGNDANSARCWYLFGRGMPVPGSHGRSACTRAIDGSIESPHPLLLWPDKVPGVAVAWAAARLVNTKVFRE